MPKKNRRRGKLFEAPHRFRPPLIPSLTLLILAVFVVFIPGQSVYTTVYADLNLKIGDNIGREIEIPQPAPYPRNHLGSEPDNTITAYAISVRDAESGVFMYEKNAALAMAPASTSKIMTALVALDLYPLSSVVTVDTPLVDGQVMGLVAGERITVENLLYGILIHSGNDAAYALADYHPDGVAGFIKAMNQLAERFHLTGSSFQNPMGFDDPSQRMTAHDLALLAGVAMQNETVMKMVSLPAITVSDVTYTHFHQLKNINQLLGKIPGVAGIKTGWTEEAGENLVTLVERNGKKVILVVLKSQDRFGDTTKLIDWVFSAHQWETYYYDG
jgi:D-alanyl-D-alanine carboxypeptidase